MQWQYSVSVIVSFDFLLGLCIVMIMWWYGDDLVTCSQWDVNEFSLCFHFCRFLSHIACTALPNTFEFAWICCATLHQTKFILGRRLRTVMVKRRTSASRCVHLEHHTRNPPAWLFGWKMMRPVPFVIVCFLARSAKRLLAKEKCQHCASSQGHNMMFCLGFPKVENSKQWLHSHTHQCWLRPWPSFSSNRPWLQDGQSWSGVGYVSHDQGLIRTVMVMGTSIPWLPETVMVSQHMWLLFFSDAPSLFFII